MKYSILVFLLLFTLNNNSTAAEQIPFKKKMNLECIININNNPKVYQYQLDGKAVWFMGSKMELGVAKIESFPDGTPQNESLITRENNIVKYSLRTLKTGVELMIEQIKSIEILIDISDLKAEMIVNDNQKFLGYCLKI
tara:strand:- start:125 stop:541 length:417 start_codon:yes stop_codon:yes gene_type:complete